MAQILVAGAGGGVRLEATRIYNYGRIEAGVEPAME